MGPHATFPPSASATPPPTRKRRRSSAYDEPLSYSRSRRVLPNATVLEMIPEEPEEEEAANKDKSEDEEDACRPRKKARITLDDPLDARRTGTRDRRRVIFSRRSLATCPSVSTSITHTRDKQRHAVPLKSLQSKQADAAPSTPTTPPLPSAPPLRIDPILTAPAPSDPPRAAPSTPPASTSASEPQHSPNPSTNPP